MQPTPTLTAERLAKLADLDTLRLQAMDAGRIDLQRELDKTVETV